MAGGWKQSTKKGGGFDWKFSVMVFLCSGAGNLGAGNLPGGVDAFGQSSCERGGVRIPGLHFDSVRCEIWGPQLAAERPALFTQTAGDELVRELRGTNWRFQPRILGY